MTKKLQSMRILEGQGVPYEAVTFSLEGDYSAEDVAAAIDMPPARVYKTLVVDRGRGKPLLVMLASDRALDLKKLAAAAGEKKLRMAAQRDAEAWTGLQVGGISALALLHKHWDVFIDRPAPALDEIVVSAGERGVQIRLAPADLIRVTGARPADVSR